MIKGKGSRKKSFYFSGPATKNRGGWWGIRAWPLRKFFRFWRSKKHFPNKNGATKLEGSRGEAWAAGPLHFFGGFPSKKAFFREIVRMLAKDRHVHRGASETKRFFYRRCRKGINYIFQQKFFLKYFLLENLFNIFYKLLKLRF